MTRVYLIQTTQEVRESLFLLDELETSRGITLVHVVYVPNDVVLGYDLRRRRVVFNEEPYFLSAVQKIVDGKKEGTIKEITLSELEHARIEGMKPKLREALVGKLPLLVGNQPAEYIFEKGDFNNSPFYDEVKALVEELMTSSVG